MAVRGMVFKAWDGSVSHAKILICVQPVIWMINMTLHINLWDLYLKMQWGKSNIHSKSMFCLLFAWSLTLEREPWTARWIGITEPGRSLSKVMLFFHYLVPIQSVSFKLALRHRTDVIVGSSSKKSWNIKHEILIIIRFLENCWPVTNTYPAK